MSKPMRRRNRQVGVTLLELMIVMAIVGILAAIAYPSYRQSVLKGNRSEAKIGLSIAAQELEKCFTQNNTYMDVAGVSPCWIAGQLAGAGRTTETGKYLITNIGAPAQLTYSLQATPQADQADDTKCGTLTLDNTGQRGVIGAIDTWQNCW